MIVAVADTHTAIGYLFSDARLGRNTSAFIDATIASGDHIGISAISLAEMVYLIEKKRMAATALRIKLLPSGLQRSNGGKQSGRKIRKPR